MTYMLHHVGFNILANKLHHHIDAKYIRLFVELGYHKYYGWKNRVSPSDIIIFYAFFGEKDQGFKLVSPNVLSPLYPISLWAQTLT